MFRERCVGARLSLALGFMLAWPTYGEGVASDDAGGPSADRRLVFGSFTQPENAQRFASRVTQMLALPVEVASATVGAESRPADSQAARQEATRYRVVGPPASAELLERWSTRAQELGLQPWRLQANADPGNITNISATASTNISAAATAAPMTSMLGITVVPRAATAESRLEDRLAQSEGSRSPPAGVFNLDMGLQNRLFASTGANTTDQAQQSASAQLQWSREFSGGRNLLALDVFGRWDSDDDRRSHADLRELSVTHVADRWQLQAGVGQVFWGVVEFNHLIDVVNQTDLVENLDTEDKLGQPMVALTLLPDWGSIEFYVLPGFRERTLPGISGRLTTAVPVDHGAALFESGAGDKRVDGLVRVSTQFGGVLFDVYHFNGTRRTPRFEVRPRDELRADLVLIPAYDTIKQTAIAAQANAGDTAFKLEALQQDGGPESYWAGAIGVEHTFVGVFGGSSDIGAVVEYHYDSRGGRAFDSFFESDLAIGARLGANDIHDSQALLGVVWDTSSQERVILLEASRRLNDRWSLALESRWFGGGDSLGRSATLAELLDPNNKLGSVQRDDYIQFEFTRFF